MAGNTKKIVSFKSLSWFTSFVEATALIERFESGLRIDADLLEKMIASINNCNTVQELIGVNTGIFKSTTSFVFPELNAALVRVALNQRLIKLLPQIEKAFSEVLQRIQTFKAEYETFFSELQKLGPQEDTKKAANIGSTAFGPIDNCKTLEELKAHLHKRNHSAYLMDGRTRPAYYSVVEGAISRLMDTNNPSHHKIVEDIISVIKDKHKKSEKASVCRILRQGLSPQDFDILLLVANSDMSVEMERKIEQQGEAKRKCIALVQRIIGAPKIKDLIGFSRHLSELGNLGEDALDGALLDQWVAAAFQISIFQKAKSISENKKARASILNSKAARLFPMMCQITRFYLRGTDSSNTVPIEVIKSFLELIMSRQMRSFTTEYLRWVQQFEILPEGFKAMWDIKSKLIRFLGGSVRLPSAKEQLVKNLSSVFTNSADALMETDSSKDVDPVLELLKKLFDHSKVFTGDDLLQLFAIGFPNLRIGKSVLRFLVLGKSFLKVQINVRDYTDRTFEAVGVGSYSASSFLEQYIYIGAADLKNNQFLPIMDKLYSLFRLETTERFITNPGDEAARRAIAGLLREIGNEINSCQCINFPDPAMARS